MKVEAPENFLGPYLTKKLKDTSQDSTDISEATEIHVETVRKMRNGNTKSIPAIESYLLALFTGDSIADYLKEVYPSLKLKHTDKPVSKNIKSDTTKIGVMLFSLEEYDIDILAYRTGLNPGRLRRLTKLGLDKIETYELALIEMAADKKPGDLFEQLFKGVGLRKEK